MLQPQTLHDAIGLSKLVEDKCNASRPLPHFFPSQAPISGSSPPTKATRRQPLSPFSSQRQLKWQPGVSMVCVLIVIPSSLEAISAIYSFFASCFLMMMTLWMWMTSKINHQRSWPTRNHLISYSYQNQHSASYSMPSMVSSCPWH